MTVEFSQNGKKLQLADGKKATISMPLEFNTHYDGAVVKAGDSIPMWHFSEEKGLWVEEGQGQVTTNDDGALVLTADVAHFTTWNWDMKFENPASLFVNCQLPNGAATACSVFASISYNNGTSTKTKSTQVTADGIDVVNIDSNLDSLTLTGYFLDKDTGQILSGTFTSDGLPDTATIILDKIVDNMPVIKNPILEDEDEECQPVQAC